VNPALLIAIIQNVVVPEVSGIIRRHRAQTGADPTDAEIIAKLQLDATKYIDEGEAWLAAHPDSAA
jgi:DNA-directed RNA polymerase specialized sigma subunit